MPVVAPARYVPIQHKSHRRKPILRLLLVVVLVLGLANYLRPLPSPTATVALKLPASTTSVPLSWPSQGQAAIAADGYGLLGTYGTQTPLATASIAKVITALCVLQKQPLAQGQGGPTYTISSNDVDIYQNYVAQNGSVVTVQQGEQLSEYEALEALMIPSANNIADSLVHWVFGSQTNYAAYATAFLQQHGLNQTHIGSDASGFQPDTTSSASDLTSLGLLALKNPVLMEIAGKPSVVLPVAGTVDNYDTILGNSGITGLKTGNNDADPGAFLFTASRRIGNRDIDFTGAVMGATDLSSALSTAQNLSESMRQNFSDTTIVPKGRTVGSLKTAWGSSTDIIATSDLELMYWNATPLTETHKLTPSATSGNIGSLQVASGQVHAQTTLQLAHQVPKPSVWWRLTRR